MTTGDDVVIVVRFHSSSLRTDNIAASVWRTIFSLLPSSTMTDSCDFRSKRDPAWRSGRLFLWEMICCTDLFSHWTFLDGTKFLCCTQLFVNWTCRFAWSLIVVSVCSVIELCVSEIYPKIDAYIRSYAKWNAIFYMVTSPRRRVEWLNHPLKKQARTILKTGRNRIA